MTGDETRWAALTGSTSGADYQARFDTLARSGRYLHGEADLCAGLVATPARILDAGCGTGRVAIRLAELGYACVGVDADASMLAVAQGFPEVEWQWADLAVGPLPSGFDLVVAAGNVIPLLAPGTLATTMSNLASAMRPGGFVVTGLGLDAGHLPADCPVTSLSEFDAAGAAAGLRLVERFATWERAQYDGGGYAVSVQQLG